jgi:hypothetical protein
MAAEKRASFAFNWTLGCAPVVLPKGLTGAVYHRFLVNDLPVLLDHVPHHQRQHMRFMHEGAPPHFLSSVRLYLNQTFGEQWTGSAGAVNWPARSPDPNHLDFWLWGHLKTSVCSAPINDIEVTATSRECLSGGSSETRNIRQSGSLCAMTS